MTTETKIIDGVPWVRADLALPMPVLREDSGKRADGMPASATDRHLRRLLADKSGIAQLYRDDGEAAGSSRGLHFDFMRDDVAELDAKFRMLGERRWAEQKAAPDRAAQVAEVMRLAKLHGTTCRGDGVELAHAGDTVLTAKKCADSLAALEAAVKRLAGV